MTWTIPVPRMPGYSLKPTDPVIRTDMEFGAKRTRRRTFARNDVVTVAWYFSDADFTAFRAWFDGTACGGAAWFNIPLALGDGGIKTEEAKFAKMYKADPAPGLFWNVSATLEVR